MIFLKKPNFRQKVVFNWKTTIISSCIITLFFLLTSCAGMRDKAIAINNANIMKGIDNELNTTNLDEASETKLPNLALTPNCSPSVLVLNVQKDNENIKTSENLNVPIKRSAFTDLTVSYLSKRLQEWNVEIDSSSREIIKLSLKECALYGFMGYATHIILRVEVPTHGFDKMYDRTEKSVHFSKPVPVAFSMTIHRVVQDLLEDVEFQNIIQCKKQTQ
ncbi:hypothetical protein QUF75_11215 [Desulfococcaceae bacterium HSG7]|nr:hypothetical protein [Desulfococcaceae bacterium HSG7]